MCSFLKQLFTPFCCKSNEELPSLSTHDDEYNNMNFYDIDARSFAYSMNKKEQKGKERWNLGHSKHSAGREKKTSVR